MHVRCDIPDGSRVVIRLVEINFGLNNKHAEVRETVQTSLQTAFEFLVPVF